jgi:carbonic anhydrase/acetyltransferase-like protein (isoleucine patch superfamily)
MNLIEHGGVVPAVHASARIAPTAVIVGDVTVGAGTSVGYGAVLTAESGPIRIGCDCIVMDTAVLRGITNHPVDIGDRVLVGPRSHLSGCTVEDEVFLATGTTVLNGAHLEHGVEVRINGVVHIRTRLPAFATVPIGWVAVGDPAEILPPDQHEAIWKLQRPLDFPGYVFGAVRPADGVSLLAEVAPRYAAALTVTHLADRVIPQP